MKENYEIKITGSGTRQQIIDSLKDLRKAIKDANPFDLENWDWADFILIVKVCDVSEINLDELFNR